MILAKARWGRLGSPQGDYRRRHGVHCTGILQRARANSLNDESTMVQVGVYSQEAGQESVDGKLLRIIRSPGFRLNEPNRTLVEERPGWSDITGGLVEDVDPKQISRWSSDFEGGAFWLNWLLRRVQNSIYKEVHTDGPSRCKSLTEVGSSKESWHPMEAILMSAVKMPMWSGGRRRRMFHSIKSTVSPNFRAF